MKAVDILAKNKKNKSIKRIITITVLVISGLTVVSTVLVGNYLIEFALVTNNGGENRVVLNEQEVGTVSAAEKSIAENESSAINKRKEWLEEVEPRTNDVEIQSADGLKLRGHTYKQEEASSLWTIVVHGYQSDESEAQTTARYYYKQGYNVLTMNLRSHGSSEGDYIGMGLLDKDDLIQWTDFIIEENAEAEIVYHGTSMGGATVLMAAGAPNLPDNVKSVISDCAYSSIWGIFTSELDARFNLPSFPFLNMGQIMGQVRASYNIADGDVAKFVEQSDVPILFIHSEPDDFVPVAMVHELYEAKRTGDKDLFITANGTHGQAKYAEPEEYFQRVFAFHSQYFE